ncbi:DUF6134 family protein [Methylocella sp.]|uniref:DUF6134 family protein n=1 Tax=Methylocella sp. TaxID=1978226 RepID=UPI003783703A
MKAFSLALAMTAALAAAAPLRAEQAAPKPAAAKGAHPAKAQQTFDIIRKGDKIGVNTVDIERKGDLVTVKNKTDISVKVLGFEAYRYAHMSNETWKGDQLVAFSSQTDDNGKKHAVKVEPGATPDKLTLIVDGKKSEESKTLTPATLWSRALVSRADLFDPADGTKLVVSAKDLGEDKISVAGAERRTQHYQLEAKAPADFSRDLWFEGDDLVRMKMTGSDKSVIVSDLVK